MVHQQKSRITLRISYVAIAAGLALSSCGAHGRHAATSGAPPHSAHRDIYVRASDCDRPALRPMRIVLVCGGGQDVVDRLRWLSYGGDPAVAYGEVLIDDCRPDCASGRLVANPAIVAVAGIERCADGRWYYSRLGMTFTLTPPVPLETPFDIGPRGSCTPA